MGQIGEEIREVEFEPEETVPFEGEEIPEKEPETVEPEEAPTVPEKEPVIPAHTGAIGCPTRTRTHAHTLQGGNTSRHARANVAN